MKASVHFLNVGWGDSHFIQLPSGFLTLIDGGDGNPEPHEDSPLLWMERHQAERLDCMILTHLHEDHLNGLLEVARDKEVVCAILPYEPFELPPWDMIEEQEKENTKRVFRLLESYLKLIHLLQEKGTKIIWRNRYNSAETSVIWSQEGYTLKHLYPWRGDPLVGREVLDRALKAFRQADEGWPKLFQQFFDLSNHDCSVYRLTCDGRAEQEGILFGGDLLEEGWVRLAKRTNLQSYVWKAPHHGMKDGLNNCTLELVKPSHSVIPISTRGAAGMHAYWESLRKQTTARFHVTGDIPRGEQICIWDGPIRVYMGS